MVPKATASHILAYLSSSILTSNCISSIFRIGHGAAGIQKMRSIFFERCESSCVAVTQPAGWGGESSNLKKSTYLREVKEEPALFYRQQIWIK